MDINLDLIKRIISSDELCDKVNSASYKESYKEQICKYILSLDFNKNNISYIDRYIRKFINNNEESFFDPVLLKIYSLNDNIFNNILNNFNNIKEILIKKYNKYVNDNYSINNNELLKMFKFYCYVCSNYFLPKNYIDYLIKNSIKNNFVFDYDLICYFYKQFALSFALEQNLNINFVITDNITNDPYYDNKNTVTIYKHNITNKIDYKILASIFEQIKKSYLLKCINEPNNNYSFEQLRLVKEISLISILGDDYFNNNYGDISFTTNLRKDSYKTVKDYFNKLGLGCSINYDIEEIVLDSNLDDNVDKAISIDILFDQIINREGTNLLRSLIKNYPVLGCEYKSDKKKSLLTLLTDIYSNRKLLNTLNKDLEWYKSKDDGNEVVKTKIDKLNNKISICTSYISVMNLVIKCGDMTSSDILRSISDLILYDTHKKVVQDDIISILMVVLPKKIERLCMDRNNTYVENFRKRIVECYLKSMSIVRDNMDMDYFMRLYATLENINKVFINR